MGALVTAFETAVLNHWFRNEDIPGIGDAGGLRGSATAGNWYVSGCLTWPGETASQNSGEATYTGYLRHQAARSSAGWSAAVNGTIAPAAPIQFGERTDGGAAQEICYVIIGDSSGTGAGTARTWGAVVDASFVARPFSAASTASDTIRIVGHGLASGDRIAFFNFESFANMPGGLTEGTVYHVRSGGLTADEFTVATTAGGAAVDITSLGDGYAIKIKPIVVVQGVNPTLDSNSVVRLG